VGGNILNDTHLDYFVKKLVDHNHYPEGNGSPSSGATQQMPQKLAATLFFHEHVISILKLQRTLGKKGRNGETKTLDEYWYDVIDSLPSQRFLKRPSESDQELVTRLGLHRQMSSPGSDSDSLSAQVPRTVRVRCLTEDAVKVVLRWYACSKFTEENHAFINQYTFDERLADFDPRVFQAFIWGSVL
jgi:hypothetical protein